MLQYIAHLAIAAPRRIIVVAVLVMVGAAVFGIPGIKSLSAAGLPGSDGRVGAGRRTAVRQVRSGRPADDLHGHF